ncbi:hypothetical protein Fcan01_27965 [Folsomia candida]|uniref:No apical meristem-associated C-terminal domain-containing protein n=1 Tax=Folsomia candida TaxID=158441 RepID=A0A226CXY2_FOLCA|nr:hypothetical protein Fcan01_27965 [Folsomia candida]
MEWRNRTGQGVLELEGEQSVKRTLLNMCPLFDELDEIYGEKATFDPPHLHDSSSGTLQAQSWSDFGRDDELNAEDEEIPETEINVDVETVSQKPSTPGKLIANNLTSARKDLGKRKHADSGISALAEASIIRTELQKQEIILARDKWEEEKRLKNLEYELKLRQYEDEQKLQERKLALEELKLQNEMEISRYRIDKECSLKLELAQIKAEQI